MRIILDFCPDAGVLDVTTKLLEAECTVWTPEQVDAAVLRSVFDAVDNYPGGINAFRHRAFYRASLCRQGSPLPGTPPRTRHPGYYLKSGFMESRAMVIPGRASHPRLSRIIDYGK